LQKIRRDPEATEATNPAPGFWQWFARFSPPVKKRSAGISFIRHEHGRICGRLCASIAQNEGLETFRQNRRITLIILVILASTSPNILKLFSLWPGRVRKMVDGSCRRSKKFTATLKGWRQGISSPDLENATPPHSPPIKMRLADNFFIRHQNDRKRAGFVPSMAQHKRAEFRGESCKTSWYHWRLCR
jgi:hypothetical protein